VYVIAPHQNHQYEIIVIQLWENTFDCAAFVINDGDVGYTVYDYNDNALVKEQSNHRRHSKLVYAADTSLGPIRASW